MNSELFEDFLNDLNKEMTKEKIIFCLTIVVFILDLLKI